MAISLNSVVGFNSTFPAKYQQAFRSSARASSPKSATQSTFSLALFRSRVCIEERRRTLCLPVTDSDRLASESTDKDSSGSAEGSVSDAWLSPAESPEKTSKFQTEAFNEPEKHQISGASNGSAISSDTNQEKRPNIQSAPKRSPLTARDRLRAARVLSRYTESKASKSGMGSKLLDALKESDKKGKKRSGLPEAPTNLFDDSDRGLPKEGWTFQFPGGSDLFLIAVSFVLISTIMFTTTYIVWKVGAIHFNEY